MKHEPSRWETGEQLAAEERIEVVALCFPHDTGRTWIRLRNVADDKRHHFIIEDAEVRAVIKQYGAPVCLWHSHLDSEEPSRADIENFPDWIPYGLVFDLATGNTTRYDSNFVHEREQIMPVNRPGLRFTRREK